MSSDMENAQNFAAIISSMVLGPSFFRTFSKFSQFSIFSCAHFSIFPCFPIFGVGEGVFSHILGFGGVFPCFLRYFPIFWGWGVGWRASLIWPLRPVTGNVNRTQTLVVTAPFLDQLRVLVWPGAQYIPHRSGGPYHEGHCLDAASRLAAKL